MSKRVWIAPSLNDTPSRSCGVPKVFEFFGYRVHGHGLRERVLHLPVYSVHSGQLFLAQSGIAREVLAKSVMQTSPNAQFNLLPLHYSGDIRAWHQHLTNASNIYLPKGWRPTRDSARIALIGGRGLDENTAGDVVSFIKKVLCKLSGRTVIHHTCSEFTPLGETLKNAAQHQSEFPCSAQKANWDTFGHIHSDAKGRLFISKTAVKKSSLCYESLLFQACSYTDEFDCFNQTEIDQDAFALADLVEAVTSQDYGSYIESILVKHLPADVRRSLSVNQMKISTDSATGALRVEKLAA